MQKSIYRPIEHFYEIHIFAFLIVIKGKMKNKLEFQPKLVSALKNYSKEKFMSDLMAGIIVGIVGILLLLCLIPVIKGLK